MIEIQKGQPSGAECGIIPDGWPAGPTWTSTPRQRRFRFAFAESSASTIPLSSSPRVPSRFQVLPVDVSLDLWQACAVGFLNMPCLNLKLISSTTL